MKDEHDSDRWSVQDKRIDLVEWVQRQVGCLYRWGGKGQHDSTGRPMYDCSGLVTCGLLAVGCDDWRQTHGAARLYDDLAATAAPAPMDLAFYGRPGHVSHVVFVWGDGRVLGACGGNESTTTEEIARSAGACVKFRTSIKYRPDLRGYRVLPVH